jgi:hypothetical protein
LDDALDEPELPPPMAPWEIEELAALEERNDELTNDELWDYAYLLQIKNEYEERLAAYRAYFGIPALESADDVNENENNE